MEEDPSANQQEDSEENDDYYMFGVEHNDFQLVDLVEDEEAPSQQRELPAIGVKIEDATGGAFDEGCIWSKMFFCVMQQN